MTKTETAKLLYVVKAVYYKSFEKMAAQDFDNMLLAWEAVLSEYSYAECSYGLQIYLAAENKGFPPVPGQIIDCINKVRKKPELDMTALEAWALVRKAMSNSIYNSEQEFAKLPLNIQRAVGTPSNLREMAQLDIDRVETVEQSHFIRTYEARLKEAREEAKLPPDLLKNARAMIEKLEGQQDKQLTKLN